jgi:long-chain acyl-CoA synthetase
MLLETPFAEPPDFSSLRSVASSGGPLPATIVEGFARRWSIRVRAGYGTTEAGSVAPGDGGPGPHRPGCVGRPFAPVTVEIRGPDDRPLPAGQTGRLVIRTPAAATGYLDAPAATAAVFRDGWVHTGDLGRYDEAGRLFVLGRDKPMIIVAGRKVAPAEVEACLRAHPCVAAVAVRGEGDGAGGERVKAFVVPAGEVTARQLQEFCGERLADFKVPRTVEFVASLARGPLGKTVAPDGAADGAD